MPQPRIIDVERARKAQTVTLPADVAATLNERRSRLSADLGFEVSPAETIAWLLKRFTEAPSLQGPAMPVQPTAIPPRGFSPQDIAEVRRLMNAGQKIDAIRYARDRSGLGLKEAKDFAETFHDGRDKQQ